MRNHATPGWMRLVRVFHRIDHQLMGQLRARGLSLAQFDVLIQVSAQEGLTQQELADKLLVTKGNVCQVLDRMSQLELITRRQDGRANRLFLTCEGERLIGELLPTHEAMITTAFAPLSNDEQRQLRHLLRKVERGLEMPQDT